MVFTEKVWTSSLFLDSYSHTHLWVSALLGQTLFYSIFQDEVKPLSAKLNCSFFACPKFDIRRQCFFAGNPIIDPSAYASDSLAINFAVENASLIGSKFGAKKNLVGLTAKNFLKTEGGDLVQLAAVPYETSGETRLRVAEVYGKIMINSWSLRDTDHYIQVKNLYILTRRESILM